MAAVQSKPWIQTFTGKAVTFPMTPDMIDIKDIAHALSLQCRYAGHCKFFYSVAEHSVVLASYFFRSRDFQDVELAKAALMHDASEAYLTDLPRPVKRLVPAYTKLENQVAEVIEVWAGLENSVGLYPPDVKKADYRICNDEREQIMGPAPMDWEIPGGPLGVTIYGWAPQEAERAFLNWYRKLFL